MIGLSIALELAVSGQRVHVIDRQKIATGTSWAAAGVLPAAGPPDRARDEFESLCAMSNQLYPDWVARLQELSGIDPQWDCLGGVHIARSVGESIALQVAADQWREQGIDFTLLKSTAEWQHVEPQLVPAVESGSIRGGYFFPSEAAIRPPRLLRALVKACDSNNVLMSENVEIQSIKNQKDGCSQRVISLVTNQGEISATQLCIAAGSWSNQVTRQLDWELDVRPFRGQVALFKQPDQQLKRVINQGPNYVVPRRDGHVFVGSTVEDVGFDTSLTDQAIEELVEFAGDVCPRLRDTRPIRTWAGLRPGTGDGVPLIGKLPTRTNVVVATGHYRSGICLAPATAVILKQLLLEGQSDWATQSFRIQRQ